MKHKILFLIESFSGGGAEKVLRVLLKHFDYSKYEVTVCPIVDTGVYSEEVKRYVDHYLPIISYRGNTLSNFWNKIKYKLVCNYLPLGWVYKLFVPKGNDVEIAFCEGYVTKLLSKGGSKSRKIAWVHTDLTDNPWPIELGIFKDVSEEKAAYSVYDRIVTVSKTVEQSFDDRYGLTDRTYTIYNPIDAEDILLKAGKEANDIHEDFRLISVGRLVPQKGYDRLLKVVKRLHDDGYKLNLAILGEGEERKELEEYINANNMSSYVSLPGFDANPYKAMRKSVLFVCSSRAEGYSLVIAEALVLGLPVVSTYCSGPNELLGNGQYGKLVENSEEGLYQGIKMLLNDQAKLKELCELSLSRGNQFGVEESKRLIEQLLEEL